MKKILIKYSYMFLLVLPMSACKNNQQPQETAVAPKTEENIVTLSAEQLKQTDVQLAGVEHKKMGNTLKLNGQIDVPPQNLVSVSVALGGYLKSTNMLPGTRVSKGQVLAVMEDAQYIQLQQDYLITKSKLTYANREYERQKELNSAKAGSDKVLQQAETDLRQLSVQSKAFAERLRLIGINPAKLNENTISRTIALTSPINGYVSKVNVNIGKYVMPADVIFELVNPTDIHLSLTVFEKDLNKIKIGQKVMAYTNARPDQQYETEVVLVSHALNDERNAEVHCHFEKYDRTLAPGMYMSAELQLNNEEQQVLPDEAIVAFENKDYVFVAIADHSFKLTPINKGQTNNGITAVDANLNSKKIVVKGAYSLLMKLKNTAD